MARKIFVSYKHRDWDVRPIPNGQNDTARDYVDYMESLFDGEEIYKGERSGEDLSAFTNDQIRSQLRDQIFDSSVTIVLISPNMVDPSKTEKEQFIPWEISYALQVRSRGERVSGTNAVLAVVLPDCLNSYGHFIQQDSCDNCTTTRLQTGNTFRIIANNMFNRKYDKPTDCSGCNSYTGPHSYIPYVKWDHFILDPDKYICEAQNRKDNIDDYKLCKYLD